MNQENSNMTDTKSQHAPGTEASGVLLHPVKGKVIAVTSGKGGAVSYTHLTLPTKRIV